MPKTILITRASRGSGFEMTRQAIERGDQVIDCARDIENASKLLKIAKKI